jgi:RNA polymerase sigma factor (TIGR02999 family)
LSGAEGGSAASAITAALVAWGRGESGAADRLLELVYPELHRIAVRQMRREREGHTLQPTAVVHEAYLKLVDQSRVDWRNRAHFLGVAAQAMRRLLVDHARGRAREKRGGGATLVELESAAGEAGLAVRARSLDVLALDQALDRLAALDPAQARLVELRCFGGLSVEEAAEALGISTATAGRDFRSARAFLARELGAPPLP